MSFRRFILHFAISIENIFATSHYAFAIFFFISLIAAFIFFGCRH
jgi:hypothetical protein